MRGRSAMLAKNFKSTFLSCEKDQEAIWRKLFIESNPYSNKLKRLLVINTKDCLDCSQEQYNIKLEDYDLATLKEKGYIKVVPKLDLGDFEEVKSYILLEFDTFAPTSNAEYRSSIITFTIMCHLDQWELDDYKLRPLQIAGYIDGIMDGSRLSGIGQLQFMGAEQLILNEHLGGIMIRYIAYNGNDNVEKVNPKLTSENI
jgi:hypothetical protein